MKAIMISIKPKWCAKIMNGEKTVEVRTSKALYKAIQKLIDENGYADIYVYCSKDKKNYLYGDKSVYKGKKETFWCQNIKGNGIVPLLNSKVVFKFRCYKVDDYVNGRKWSWKVGAPLWGVSDDYEHMLKDACLTDDELRNYADDLSFYAIHIADLEIFDDPKELNDFYRFGVDEWANKHAGTKIGYVEFWNGIADFRLTNAPQNYCYVEIEK